MRTPPADETLRQAGLRPTPQRQAVVAALAGREQAVTALQLHLELRATGSGVGLATVYRTLTALAEAGFLDTFQRQGEQAFRWCATVHHHHLVCERCDRVEELEATAVERWVREVAEESGYRVTGHRADIFGVCGDCR